MSIQLIIRNPLDRDAREFIQRAGVSNATGRAQLNEFVRGVKALGLWSSMVCWPLRSTQNAGTGTTAFSLGGLGTFNGTLVNGPTWGADGITNSATGVITNGYADLGGAQAHIFVGNSTTASANRAFGTTLSDANTRGIRWRDDQQFWGDGAFRTAVVNLTNAGVFKMAGALFNQPQTAFIYLNTTQNTMLATGAVLSGNTTLRILNTEGVNQTYSGTAAFYGLIATSLSASQYLSLNNLYKQTLGTGLGLP